MHSKQRQSIFMFLHVMQDTSGKVPNLEEGEEYIFRVRAINELGEGEPSRPTDPVVVENQPGKY